MNVSNDLVEIEHRELQNILLYILNAFSELCEKHKLQYWLDAGTFLGAVRHKGFIPWDDDIDICMPRKDYDIFVASVYKELPADFFLQNAGTDSNISYYFSKIRLNDSQIILKNNIHRNADFHAGIFIDIFPIDKVPEKALYRSFHRFLLRILAVSIRGNKLIYPATLPVHERIRKYFSVSFSTLIRVFLSDKKLLKLHRSLSSAITDQTDFLAVVISPIEYYKRIRYKPDIFPLKKYTFEGKQYWGPKSSEKNLSRQFGKDYMTLPPLDKRTPPHSSKIYVTKSLYDRLVTK